MLLFLSNQVQYGGAQLEPQIVTAILASSIPAAQERRDYLHSMVIAQKLGNRTATTHCMLPTPTSEVRWVAGDCSLDATVSQIGFDANL